MSLAACAAQMRQPPMPGLLALSALGWALYLALPRGAGLAAFCGAVSLPVMLDPAAWGALGWAPGRLALEWAVMVLMMMPPLVSAQVAHVVRSVRRTCRLRALLAFGLGYGICWLLAGVFLVPLGLMVSALLPAGLDTAALLAVALVWSAAPPAQGARNRCHRLERIGAQGEGALRHGGRTGLACVAACWVWMVVPLTVSAGHGPAMLAVALYLFAERLAPAAKRRWRVPPGLGVLAGLGVRARLRRAPPGLATRALR
ncbi:MAG: hypothetical protein EP318_05390 [Rhodobacteraceae bacterium]|nr:MAG: hypothetical protein EP318_05390 [Paracoccaceae bacterium]